MEITNPIHLNLLKTFSGHKPNSDKKEKTWVKKYLGTDKIYNGFKPSAFFSKAYDLRSKFVHNGKTETKYLKL
jgi:hypothetical protein